MTARNTSAAPAAEPKQRGRPRTWKNDAEKQRGHRAVRRERARLVDELLHAVRNAHWEEPELHTLIQEGEDNTILQALTRYYRARHWMLRSGRSQVPAEREK